MGQGAWSKMNDREKEKMWSAYRRIIEEIVTGYGNSYSSNMRLRLLHLEEKENEAEATCRLYRSDLLLKLRFVRRNGLWSLVEIQQSDTGLLTFSDTLQTTISAIEKVHAGQKPPRVGLTDFARVLLLMREDAAKAVAFADNALKAKPADKGLRLLKALSLLQADKEADGVKLLRELSNEDYAPAIYKLARNLSAAKDEPSRKETVKLWERYTSLEPYDPRGFRNLGIAHKVIGDLGPAEAAYRKAIEIDPAGSAAYLHLVLLLAANERVAEVKPVLVAYDEHKDTDEDVFESAIRELFFADERAAAEKLAASEPARVKTSSAVNVLLGRIHMDAGRYTTAFTDFTIAAQLDKKSSGPYVMIAELHRKQSRFAAALKAADQAINLDKEDSEAHYQRACALARLGRLKDAMSALERSIELDDDQLDYIADEADLKPLSALPAFKKLLAPPAEKP
jgi:tetratricopeptide (TPR) repeat protein